MEDQPVWKRMSFQECMELARIPSTEDDDKKQNSIQRFQSRQPAWKPGQDLVWGEIPPQPSRAGKPGPAAYGGHVYAQAALAAARAVEAEERDKPADKRLAIHVGLVFHMLEQSGLSVPVLVSMLIYDGTC